MEKEREKMIAVLVLGRGCNLKCKYCIQKDEPVSPSDKNLDAIINFLKENSHAIDKLCFYGGEPLLYFNDIMKICRAPGIKGFKKMMPTNGLLLTEDIVKTLNQEEVEVIVSWDGTASEQSRGYDVFKEKEPLLLKIKNLRFNTVLSGTFSMRDFIEKTMEFNYKYRQLNGTNAIFDCSPVFPSNGDFGVEPYTAEHFREDLKEVFDTPGCREQYLYNIAQKMGERINSSLSEQSANYVCVKGNNVVLKMNGEILACSNRSDAIASINTPLEEIKQMVIERNSSPERAKKCHECLFHKVICPNDPCALMSDGDFDLYCKTCQQYGEVLLEEIEKLKGKNVNGSSKQNKL